MKKIEAIIREEKLEAVKKHLEEIGFRDDTDRGQRPRPAKKVSP